MKLTYFCQIFLFIIIYSSSTFMTSQDSRSSNLVQIHQFPIPFDISSLLCSPVWPTHSFILRGYYFLTRNFES
ncbi:hypothetical protein D0Y65_017025 [Glycine soja]|uniref:Uncharacterized protein n=1 Tax=Glycine soja TaxID=3848 RepID=A0A445JT04_GLYSO|nr:hypothetical protein D0Y65_017025 [Glycine soja]